MANTEIGKIKIMGRLLVVTGSLVLISCQTTTNLSQTPSRNKTQKSSDQSPRLNDLRKPVARKGNVTKGMSKDAVRSAWGKPHKTEKSGNKELWKYFRREAVEHNYTPRSGKFTKHFSSSEKYFDGHRADNLHIVERMYRSVQFENGRVVWLADYSR